MVGWLSDIGPMGIPPKLLAFCGLGARFRAWPLLGSSSLGIFFERLSGT